MICYVRIVKLQKRIWDVQNYEGVRNANTLLSFIDDIPMNETLKNEYIGRAYFHRAYRYYALVFQFGHVPLLTKLPSFPTLVW